MTSRKRTAGISLERELQSKVPCNYSDDLARKIAPVRLQHMLRSVFDGAGEMKDGEFSSSPG